MKERNWPALHAEISTKRFYPHKKIASDIIGYLGAISQEEYLSIVNEINELKNFLDSTENPSLPKGFKTEEELQARFSYLKEKAYSINDLIGKAGLEKTFENNLRGSFGKKTFAIDVSGNFLKKLEGGQKEKAGDTLITTISLELQKFAENLLLEDEKERDGKSRVYDSQKKQIVCQKQPLLKGGAIVAMVPKTSEILALASYPRFNPNDFIPSADLKLTAKKQKKINRWLETNHHIANIWDGKEKLTREYLIGTQIQKEKFPLTLELFLSTILPDQHIAETLKKMKVKEAIQLQEDVETLLYFSKQKMYPHFSTLFSEKTLFQKMTTK